MTPLFRSILKSLWIINYSTLTYHTMTLHTLFGSHLIHSNSSRLQSSYLTMFKKLSDSILAWSFLTFLHHMWRQIDYSSVQILRNISCPLGNYKAKLCVLRQKVTADVGVQLSVILCGLWEQILIVRCILLKRKICFYTWCRGKHVMLIIPTAFNAMTNLVV